MSINAREPDAPEGSCATSGTEDQSTMRELELPVESATHTLDESTKEPAEIGTAVEEFATGAFGREVKEDWPE